jgi:hypothetical protein
MPTAGRPASASPSRPRRTSSRPNDGATAAASPNATAPSNDHNITGRLPHRSDSAEAGMTAIASPPVVTDTDREAVPGETANTSTSCGSSGCVA